MPRERPWSDHPLDGHFQLMHAEVELLQVLEAVHLPSHVIQPNLAVLASVSVVSQLYQRYLVGVLMLADIKAARPGSKS